MFAWRYHEAVPMTMSSSEVEIEPSSAVYICKQFPNITIFTEKIRSAVMHLNCIGKVPDSNEGCGTGCPHRGYSS
jgi:hypothetical protein